MRVEGEEVRKHRTDLEEVVDDRDEWHGKDILKQVLLEEARVTPND